ncbi:MAG: hypothetical protein V1824_02965 [archaeon]
MKKIIIFGIILILVIFSIITVILINRNNNFKFSATSCGENCIKDLNSEIPQDIIKQLADPYSLPHSIVLRVDYNSKYNYSTIYTLIKSNCNQNGLKGDYKINNKTKTTRLILYYELKDKRSVLECKGVYLGKYEIHNIDVSNGNGYAISIENKY